MNFAPNQRFTLQSTQGETETLTVVSTQELKNETWVNVRLGADPAIQSVTAITLARMLMEQGNQVPLEDPQGLTPEQALAEFERRQATKGPPAPPELTIDQLPDLTEEQKAAIAAQRAATEAAMAAQRGLVGQPSTPRQDAAAVEARVMGLPEPAPSWAIDAVKQESGNAMALLPPSSINSSAGTVGDWQLWTNAAQAIEEWHKAQQEAITRRLTADEKQAMATLDACEGRVPGKKFSNEQARKAYVDEICLAEEGRALRAEASVRALQFWIERLTGVRR